MYPCRVKIGQQAHAKITQHDGEKRYSVKHCASCLHRYTIFINSKMRFFSNVNVSKIRMSLIIIVLNVMKYDKWQAVTFICLFAVRSVPALLLLPSLWQGTVFSSWLANGSWLGKNNERYWWKTEESEKGRSQSIPPSLSLPGVIPLLPYICPW